MWQRYLGFLFILIAIMATLLGLFLNQQHQLVASRLAIQAEQGVARQHSVMEAELSYVRSDLSYLASMPELILYLDKFAEEGDKTPDNTLVQNYQNFSTNKQRYDQIRFLDNRGDERIRINLNGGKAMAVPNDQLQSKRHRYYFTDSIIKAVGELYVSPFDLNIEHKEVELPFKPMIRFAMPAADSRGEKGGVVILNYLGNTLLRHLGRLNSMLPGRTAMLNSNGEYLISFRADQSWGFMFKGREQDQFSMQQVAVWQQMQGVSQGQIKTKLGEVYTFSWLMIGGGGQESCRHCATVIVHRLTDEDVSEAHLTALQPAIPMIVFTVLLVTLGAMILFWNIQQRHRTAAKLSELHQRIEQERDIFAVGPAVIFRWRNEFGWPVVYVSGNLQQLFGYSPDQFLKEGLGLASIVEPTYIAALTNELEAGLAAGHTTFSRSPFRLVDQRGEYHWVSDTVRVERDEQGKVVGLYSYITDITLLKSAEQELEQSRAFIQKVVDSIADPTLVLDVSNHQVVSANQAACDAYLTDQRMLQGLTCYQLSHKTDKPCDSEDEPCPIQTILESKQPTNIVHKHFDSKGLPFYVEIHATPILSEEGEVIQIIESHRDVTQHIKHHKELKHLATTDRLTGAVNRTKFEEVLDQQIIDTAQGGRQLGLIMLDLDDFKRVNDTLGHDVGDRVLKSLVAVVESNIRKYDLLSRWGGDEFFIMLPRTDLKGMEVVAETVRSAVENYAFPVIGQMTTSLGATIWHPRDDRESMAKRADQALYRSKAQGRNRVTIAEHHKELSEE
ncbi:MAG: diguanylate cyclase [Candidatus Sedimenticola sp. (ex Thyasira tokunagai)]